MIRYHLKVDSDNVKRSIVTSSVTKNETNAYVIANRKRLNAIQIVNSKRGLKKREMEQNK